jgi:hypothetical protein
MKISFEEKILDYIDGNLSVEDSKEFENRLRVDKDLTQTVNDMQAARKILNQLDQQSIPEPSATMDDKFYSMLAQHDQSRQQHWLDTLLTWISPRVLVKPLLFGASMLLFGVLIGQYKYANNSEAGKMDEMSKMQDLAVVSMLQLNSASKRLQAVSLVESTKSADKVVLSALFTTLNNDSNINVRLAVLDTLAQFSNSADVRTKLVNSINQQQSPMVQIAIAELMLQLQERKAIKPLKQLLDNKDLIEPVREKIILAVNELI